MNRISDGGLYPVGMPHYGSGNRLAASQRAETARFDQLQISRQPGGMEKRILDLTGRVEQQVHARHTTGEIARLQRQVQEGTYQPDAREIAARMLLREAE